MNIREQARRRRPRQRQWQRDLSVSCEQARRRAGGPRRPARRPPGYTESQNIAEQLAAADPGNAEWQRDLSSSGSIGGPANCRRRRQIPEAALADRLRDPRAVARNCLDSVDMQTTPVVHRRTSAPPHRSAPAARAEAKDGSPTVSSPLPRPRVRPAGSCPPTHRHRRGWIRPRKAVARVGSMLSSKTAHGENGMVNRNAVGRRADLGAGSCCPAGFRCRRPRSRRSCGRAGRAYALNPAARRGRDARAGSWRDRRGTGRSWCEDLARGVLGLRRSAPELMIVPETWGRTARVEPPGGVARRGRAAATDTGLSLDAARRRDGPPARRGRRAGVTGLCRPGRRRRHQRGDGVCRWPRRRTRRAAARLCPAGYSASIAQDVDLADEDDLPIRHRPGRAQPAAGAAGAASCRPSGAGRPESIGARRRVAAEPSGSAGGVGRDCVERRS